MKRNAIAWAALIVSTAALIGSQNWIPTVPAAPQEPQIPAAGVEQARQLSAAFESVAEYVGPSVVQISVTRPLNVNRGSGGPMGPNGQQMTPEELEEFMERFRRFFPDGGEGGLNPEDFFRFEPQQSALGTGSGFVYDDQGHILTNNHVVEGAEEGEIQVAFADGSVADATVVGADPQTDVAVIKVDKEGLRAARIGVSEDLRVGQWVLAIGSPFGLSQTVTAGIISATNRNAVGILGQEGYEDFIQTDAAINPGNSGGPLVDIEGRVIGINSAIATRTQSNAGVGFAIPIELAKYVADSLIESGKVRRARIGVVISPLIPDLAEQFGVDPDLDGILVNDVAPNSPGQKAGLKAGDVIVGFDGKPVESVPDFRLDVATSDVGKAYDLTYIREGRERSTKVTLASADDVEVPAITRAPGRRGPQESPGVELERFGLSLQDLTADLADQLGFDEGSKGVLVRSVAAGSPAEEQGINAGDLITKVVKDKKITEVADVEALRAIVGESDQLALYVESPDGLSRFVALKAKTDEK